MSIRLAILLFHLIKQFDRLIIIPSLAICIDKSTIRHNIRLKAFSFHFSEHLVQSHHIFLCSPSFQQYRV
uniref:Uncharacterized protein n=1 Tax=Rhizophora mucronata TaxID=61149 RepID=A0A2P2PYG7_RHIMU